MKPLRWIRQLGTDVRATREHVQQLMTMVTELRCLASDYLNAGHWCEAVVVGQGENGGGFVWLAQSARLREGEQTAVVLECMHAMRINAVIAQGPCVLEDFYVAQNLVFHGGGRLVIHDYLVQPGVRLVVHLRGRFGQ